MFGLIELTEDQERRITELAEAREADPLDTLNDVIEAGILALGGKREPGDSGVTI